MSTHKLRPFAFAGALTLLSVLFTLLACWVDVQPIGPQGSPVGLATLNGAVHRLVGVHWVWYHITDWLGLAPVLSALLFALVGLCQLLRRKSLRRVDGSLYLLALYYLLVLAVYVFFEVAAVNCRPVLMDGFLEPSYPSSHTLLAVCLLSAACIQSDRMLRSPRLLTLIRLLCAAVMAITVVGRLLSGVHWFTDILGGLLISATLVAWYRAALTLLPPQAQKAP